MTIREALTAAEQRLAHITDANLIIYSLLSYTITLSKEDIWAHPDILITQEQYIQFTTYIDRAAKHEPLAYITGEKEFYNLPFYVTQDVLIPRPDSENIIEVSAEYIHQSAKFITQPPTIVDVGTGSGCLAIILATIFPHATIYAIDISSKALEVAKHNAVRHHVSNVIFLQGSLLEPLQAVQPQTSLDLIMANLPYISNVEFELLPPHIKQFEPELALRSGADPDVLNRQLIRQSKDWLIAGGKVIYETTNGQIVEL